MVVLKFKPHKTPRSIKGNGTVNKRVQFSSTSHVAIRHFKFDIKSGRPTHEVSASAVVLLGHSLFCDITQRISKFWDCLSVSTSRVKQPILL